MEMAKELLNKLGIVEILLFNSSRRREREAAVNE